MYFIREADYETFDIKSNPRYQRDWQVKKDVDENGKGKRMGISRHLVLFSVERRGNWRRLQSKMGIKNKDYEAQKVLLKRLDEGEVKLSDATTVYFEILNEMT